MEQKKKLPVGIENFEEMRTEGFYYVDKMRRINQDEHIFKCSDCFY